MTTSSGRRRNMEATTSTPLERESWPRVTQILQATGIADFSKIPNSEFYLQRGTDVHMVCADITQAIPDNWTGGELEKYAVAWEKFLEDTRFKPQMVEQSVFHEQRRYRGT